MGEQGFDDLPEQLYADTGYSLVDRPRAMNEESDGARGSGKSVLAARHDVDDDMSIYMYR